MTEKKDYAILPFKTQEAFEKWLSQNHDQVDGIWARLYKKASGIKTITYAEALDEALCYGWIDGQTQRHDEKSYLQKFTPRRARSKWSQINKEHVIRLTRLGKMKPSGLSEVEKAKKDGRWDSAYASPKNMVMPEDFLKELSKDTKAAEFFETLSKTNKFAIAFNLQDAKKPETRERRMKKYIGMMKKGEKLY